MGSEIRTGEDGVSLEEIGQVLARRRSLAIAVFLASIGAAVLYLALLRPVFESDAAFYIGSFDDNWLDQPTLLGQRLTAKYGKGVREGAWVERVSFDRQDQRLVRIKVRGNSAKGTAELSGAVLADVVGEEQKRMAEITTGVESELRDLRALSGSAKRTGSPMELGAVRMRIGQLEQLLHSRVVPTEVVHFPAAVAKPVRSKQVVVTVLALFGGLFLALLAAFGAEAVAKRRPNAQ